MTKWYHNLWKLNQIRDRKRKSPNTKPKPHLLRLLQILQKKSIFKNSQSHEKFSPVKITDPTVIHCIYLLLNIYDYYYYYYYRIPDE